MKMSQLRYFVRLVENGTVNNAARRLSVSQPAITTSIKELEGELGVLLFDRSRQRLQPTRRGMYFYSRVLGALRDIDEAAIAAKAIQEGPTTLSIGVPPMIGSFVIPGLVAKLREQLQGTKIDIVERKSEELRNMLTEGLLDFVILFRSFSESAKFDGLVIIETEYGFYSSSKHRLRGSERVDFDDIKGEDFVVFDRFIMKSRTLAPMFKARGITPNIVLYTSQLETIKNYVRENLALTLLLKNCVHPGEGLIYLPFCGDLSAKIVLAWEKGKVFSPLEEKAFNAIKKLSF